ncbi:MAG: hypothetical protein JXR31_10245 [Prolixibacteraceae bacterium]|nr:hypothetical protein [Prolixibacteraceae bacterium]MBN2774618.1 hypothetical protein [Prolixibacteraceae bacterium]
MLYDNKDTGKEFKKDNKIEKILFNSKKEKSKSEDQKKAKKEMQFIVDWQIMH